MLTDVTPDNDAYREELFGPVAIVYKVGSEDEAVELANDTPFGLGSYVFTTDPEQAAASPIEIDAGMVFVNVVGADGAELPFGGVKRSGFGPRARPLRRRRVRQQEADPRRLTRTACRLGGEGAFPPSAAHCCQIPSVASISPASTASLSRWWSCSF